MSEPCPAPSRLREHVDATREGEPSELAGHVAACARCREAVAAIEAEEEALRRATFSPPPAARQDALEALRREMRSRRGTSDRPERAPRSGRTGGRWLVVGALVAGVALLVLCRHGSPPGTEPPPVETPPPPPPVVAPEKRPSPPARPAPPPSSVAPVPSDEQTGPDPLPAPPAPPEPAPPAPPPAPEALTGPTPPPAPPPAETVARALAVARSGTLRRGGVAVAAGEALHAGEALEVGSSVAVFEREGAVSVALAPRARFTLSEGEDGGLIVALASGKLFARSLGAKPYAVATRDGVATPRGTEFVVALEARATRLTTIAGVVQVAVEGAASGERGLATAGFELDFERGKPAAEARPAAGIASAGEWLPATVRPKELPPPGLVARWSFAESLPALGPGASWSGVELAPKAGPERSACGRALKAEDPKVSVLLALHDPRSPKLDPSMVFAARVKVDRRTRVTFMVWDERARDNMSYDQIVEPGAWTTLTAALADTRPRTAGSPERVRAGDACTGFTLYAGEGEPVELLVASVVFTRTK
jgi:ferric-dicitrate binding protein FerR (iron transport regulator)